MKKILIFLAGILFAYTSIYKNLKIDNIENNLVTIDIYGTLFDYYYESEEIKNE